MKMLKDAYDNGWSLHLEARALTNEEKKDYKPDWHDIMVVDVSEITVNLPHLNWELLNKYFEGKELYCFTGCNNRAVEISNEEWGEIISLERQKATKEALRATRETLALHIYVSEKAKKQADIPSPPEARRRKRKWGETYNEV